MRRSIVIAGTLLVESCVGVAGADELPVREVTVFKDGHALVLREGELGVDEAGDVTLSDLPAPILGAFWAFAADDDAELRGVTAGLRVETAEREVMDLADLVGANLGRFVRLEVPGVGSFEGVAERVIGPFQQRLLVLGVDGGRVVLPLAQARQVRIDDEAIRTVVETEQQRPYLRLDLGWRGVPSASADVGCMYIQKGLRWIPGYRITLDGEGTARVELQATLVNELADLDRVTANLVIGVPSFAFADAMDPIALQQVVAPLGPYFDAGGRSAGALSNAIMAQARMREVRDGQAGSGPSPDLGDSPELVDAGRAEDLFVFTLRNVSLRRGERMVVPISSVELPYEDVYKLDVPVAPPNHLWRSFSSGQQREIARLLDRSNVRHVVRLRNAGSAPITTAPAMIMRGDRVICQSLITFAAPGASVDIELTDAVDITVEQHEREIERVLNEREFGGDLYHLVRLEGDLAITNRRDAPVRLEIVRFVLGSLDGVTEGVEHESASVFDERAWAGAPEPGRWWGWYDWPWWWMRVNGPQRLRWTTTLAPGEERLIRWRWHYCWR